MGDARAAVRFLAGLPFERWAIRLATGHAVLDGTLSEVEVTVAGHRLVLGPGAAAMRLSFVGGARPQLASVDVATRIRIGEREAARLVVVDGSVRVDGTPLPATGAPLGSGDLVTAVLDHLGDVSVLARARPMSDAVARLPEGIEVGLSGADEIVVRARAMGPPEALVLAEPMDLRFGDRGIRLDHRSARWLARLARVRIHSATLHPDGKVTLDGSASRGLDRIVRGGLRTASVHLSGLVRRSPRFHRVREFLRSR